MISRRMDYHLHTTYSPDGKQDMMELCRRAVEAGLDEIAVTDHIDPGHPSPGVDAPPDFPKWSADIERARAAFPRLTIRRGVEIGDNFGFRKDIYSLLGGLSLDFHLLSMHLVDGADPYDQAYFEGKTQAQAYRQYAERRAQSILSFQDYDAAAHLGYVCKFAPYPKEVRPIQYGHAPDAFDEIFRYMAREGKALEINASGLIGTREPIPGPGLVKRFLELGGEFFTFGSDAHMTQRVSLRLEDCREMARALGGRWQAGFSKRVMRVYKI